MKKIFKLIFSWYKKIDFWIFIFKRRFNKNVQERQGQLNISFATHSLEQFREGIKFIDPFISMEKVTIKHPPEQFGDLTTNALRYRDKTIYKNDREWLDALKKYALPPDCKVKIQNGMVNVWLPKKTLVEVMKKII